jgi:cobalt-zinc-cadmium efflux system membrane fusion protein
VTTRTTVPSLALLLLLGCGAGSGADHAEEAGEEEEGEDREEEEGFQPVVEVDSEALESSRIRVEVARAQDQFGGVTVPAEVMLDPDRTAHVSAIVHGEVAEVRASLGDSVDSGDVLVVLRSVALGETRAALQDATANLAVAEATYERQQALGESGIGAGRNLIEAEGEMRRARARLAGLRSRARVYGRGGRGADTLIRSPIAGRVISRTATLGDVVDAGTVLFVVSDTSRVWVMGHLFAQDIGDAHTGTAAALTLASISERSWSGTLDYVAPTLDEHTRTLPVRMSLDNADGELRPGLYGTLRLAGRRSAPGTPVVPSGAVVEIQGDPFVFVSEGDEEGAFRAVSVHVGRREGGQVEVLHGLELGQSYVAAGAFVLKSEALRSQIGDDDD